MNSRDQSTRARLMAARRALIAKYPGQVSDGSHVVAGPDGVGT